MFWRSPVIRTPSLSCEEIDGDDPSFAAWEAVNNTGVRLKHSQFIKYIRGLPRHWRTIYTTFWLDCEVNNGGYHQFFWNSDGELNDETLEDLLLIEASSYVLLFQEALDIYRSHDYSDDKASSGNNWEAFTEAYREKRMETLDEAYYKIEKKLPDYLTEFIRINRLKYQNTAQQDAAANP